MESRYLMLFASWRKGPTHQLERIPTNEPDFCQERAVDDGPFRHHHVQMHNGPCVKTRKESVIVTNIFFRFHGFTSLLEKMKQIWIIFN